MTVTDPKKVDDWSSTEERLESWADKLEELRENADIIGQDVVDDLTTRYISLQTEVDQLRQRARQIRAQIKSSLNEVSDKHKEMQSS